MSHGFIKLHRQIRDCWIWERDDYLKAWIDILMMVNHKETKILFGGSLMTIERGQTVTSLSKLADRWGWSREKVRHFLKLIIDDEMAHTETHNGGTLLTVVNYGFYQDDNTDSNTDNNTQKKREKNGKKTASDTNKNEKNEKNEKNIESTSYSSNVPYQKIVDLFNSICVSLPKVKILTNNRKRAIGARYKAYNNLETFERLFQMTEGSKFLRGVSGKWSGATFDWLMNESNMAKVLEGNYEDMEEHVEKPKGSVEETYDVLQSWLARKEDENDA